MGMMRELCRLWLVFSAAALSGCGEKYVFDPRTVENSTGEAVLRHVFAECPHKAEAKALGVVLGEAQDPPSEEFRKRFANLGPRLLKHEEIVVRGVGGKIRVQERTSAGEPGELVLLLQITDLKQMGDHQEAVAAWAYKDEMQRRRYSVSGAEGKWTVQTGEVVEKSAPQR